MQETPQFLPLGSRKSSACGVYSNFKIKQKGSIH